MRKKKHHSIQNIVL